MGDFSKCVSVVCGPSIEGGFTNTPGDMGGPTNHGITLATLSAWRKRQCTLDDSRKLTLQEAEVIYRANYWAPVGGDDLPAGLDLIVFDAAVNQGPARAAQWLQAAVGAPVDGHVGPATIGAASAAPEPAAIHAVADARMTAYREASGWPTFGDGWTNRLTAILATSLQWQAEGHAP